MAKLSGMKTYENNVKRTIVSVIQKEGETIILNQLDNQLTSQVDADKKKLPEKKASTKKQYRYKGWNTEQWLVRTGKSTQLKSKKIKDGIRVYPVDKDGVLKNYVARANDFYKISDNSINLLMNKIKEKIK